MALVPTGEDELLERSDQLSALDAWLAGVANTSRGHLVLVSGEAGVGKTVLLRRFCDQHLDSARILWGACDALYTPRPLAPLVDIAHVLGGELEGSVASDARPYEVVAGLMGELGRRKPAVVVLEDLHWADEATLDVLSLLGRRVETLPAPPLSSTAAASPRRRRRRARCCATGAPSRYRARSL